MCHVDMLTRLRRAISRILCLLPPLRQLRDHNVRLTRRVDRLRGALARTQAQRAAARDRDRVASSSVRQRSARTGRA